MRKVTYGAACSLDGFIAGPDGSVDWLHMSRDVEQEMRRYWATVDTALMGRKSWEAAMRLTGGKGGSVPGVAGYVFSRTLPDPGVRGTTVVREDAADFVRRLKSSPGKDICLMGGGELAASLIAADLVDEIGLNVHPIVLGSGIPFFRDPGRRVPLELVESRTIAGGCVLARYRVVRTR